MNEPPAELMSPREVAKTLRIHTKTLIRWTNTGRIRFVRLPSGHRRYYAEDVRAMIRGEEGK